MNKHGQQELVSRLNRFRRVGFADLPTPLEPLTRLSAHLKGPRIWVKREDCTGFGFGGNKLRKLDYVLQLALDEGCDCLISGGVVQSNSQRQVAAVAAKLGLECHLAVYHGRLKPPTPEYERSGNALLNRLYGAILHDVPWSGDRNGAIVDLASQQTEAGRKPYVIPYGVSSPLGAVGYASAVSEIAKQSEALGMSPKAIVHCSGSGATQAGLVIGASCVLPDTEIVGIGIDAEPERVKADVTAYAAGAGDLLGIEFDAERIEVVAGHAGPAYGIPHAASLEAIALAGRLEAMALDPVYSGKGLAGLITMIGEGRWGPEDDIVFIHTGGSPSLFAYQGLLPF